MTYRACRLALAWGLLIGTAAGCGGGSNHHTAPPLDNQDAGLTNDGSPHPQHDAGADTGVKQDASTGTTGGSVAITIVSPTAGSTVAGKSIEVVAQVVTQSVPVDTASINAKLGNLKPVHLVANGPSVYHGFFAMGDTPSGVYKLEIDASTTDGASATVTAQIVVNAGPIITILRPSPEEPTVKSLNYDFSVKIAPALSNVHVGTVTATVGTCVVALASPAGSDTAEEYVGTVNLDLCMPRPAEGQLDFTVQAADDSAPTPIVSTAVVDAVVDRTGPIVSITLPAAGELVGGIMHVSASISDPSGVNPLSVYATIEHAGVGFTLPLAETGSGVYTATFDTRRFPNPTTIEYPAIEVVADDTLGNHGTSGGILFTIDNVPPIGDLDPPKGIIAKLDPTTLNYSCSHPFDPLGTDAVSDGDTVDQVFDIRAEVMDNGNSAQGADHVTVALVKDVTLYILDDLTKPLVVDSDGDGVCDAINPHVIATANQLPMHGQAIALTMVPISAGGAGNFAFPPDYSSQVPSFCVNATSGMIAPAKSLCLTTDMTVAVGYYTGDLYGTSVIWTIPPVKGDSYECAGIQFDSLANNVNTGWVCAAVEFEDTVGNKSVSRPLRFCIDRSGNHICPSTDPKPDCRGAYDAMTDTVTTTPCTARTFGAGPQIWTAPSN
jgi:hypothetical protein